MEISCSFNLDHDSMKKPQNQGQPQMTTLKAMQLENGQTIYVQVEENIKFADQKPAVTKPVTRGGDLFERKGGETTDKPSHQAVDKLGDVIQAMTATAASSVKDSSFGNVDKITLEFGVKLAGEVGIPFITSGKAEGAVNIKVEFVPTKSEE